MEGREGLVWDVIEDRRDPPPVAVLLRRRERNIDDTGVIAIGMASAIIRHGPA